MTRKHGEYRRLKKPLSSIVGQNDLINVVMAMMLRVPDQARGRPLTYFADHASEIFNPDYDRDVYSACVLIDRQVKTVLREKIDPELRRDLRLYISMTVCCLLCGKQEPSVQEIAALTKAVIKPIDEAIIDQATKAAQVVYKKLGGDDKAAKG